MWLVMVFCQMTCDTDYVVGDESDTPLFEVCVQRC